LAASNARVSRQTLEIVDRWLNSIAEESKLFLAEHKQKRIEDPMASYMEYSKFDSKHCGR
jgi:hypothetical protein